MADHLGSILKKYPRKHVSKGLWFFSLCKRYRITLKLTSYIEFMRDSSPARRPWARVAFLNARTSLSVRSLCNLLKEMLGKMVKMVSVIKLYVFWHLTLPLHLLPLSLTFSFYYQLSCFPVVHKLNTSESGSDTVAPFEFDISMSFNLHCFSNWDSLDLRHESQFKTSMVNMSEKLCIVSLLMNNC